MIIQILIVSIAVCFLIYLLLTIYMVYRGSNYLPTPKSDRKQVLSVLKKGDVFIDLGFGLGELLQEAVAKGAAKAIGYELDPYRYWRTFFRLKFSKDRDKYDLRFADVWSADLSGAQVVFTFFTVAHMRALYEKAKKEMPKGTWFINYVHKVKGVTPTKTIGEVMFFKL